MQLRDQFNQFSPITGTLVQINGVFIFVPSPSPDYRSRPLLGVFEDRLPLFGMFGDAWGDGPQWSGSQASWDRPDPYARRCGQDYDDWKAALPPRWSL